jgi:hypothetical protein
MVLDHLCGWVIAGAFPPGTLVTPRGFKVEPLSVFEAFQAITNHGLVHLGNWSWRMDPSKALELLSDILVTDDSVVSFCEKTDTLGPPSLPEKHMWTIATSRHLSPPPCPDAEDLAVRQSAKQRATVFISWLQQKLADFQANATPFGPSLLHDDILNFEYWKEIAQREVEISTDEELQRQLDTLDEQWAALMAHGNAAAEKRELAP